MPEPITPVNVLLQGAGLASIEKMCKDIEILVSSLGLNSTQFNLNNSFKELKKEIQALQGGTAQQRLLTDMSRKVDSLTSKTNSSNSSTMKGFTASAASTATQLGGMSLEEVESKLGKILLVLEQGVTKGSGTIKTGTGITPEDLNKEGLKSTDESESLKNALGQMEEATVKGNKLLDSLQGLAKDTLSLLKTSFRGVFDKWDSQIHVLKQTGMGASNAAALNRMTRRSMDNTEKLLGFNVSIDRAIQATNEILKSGLSPRYMRENNKQLITGLSSVGISLDSATLREMGNQVYSAMNVKELAQDWSRLVSPDSENAMEKGFVSRNLGSQEYKTVVATARSQSGASRPEVEAALQEYLMQAKGMGADDKTAWDLALMDIQRTLGKQAYVYQPTSISSSIGAMQTANPEWDINDGFVSGYVDTIGGYNKSAATQRRIDQISPTLMTGGDNTLWDIQTNDGTRRRMATANEVAEGQYEGLTARMSKYAAGLFPAESIGGMSQSLTGDSGFLTKESFSMVSDIAGYLKSGATGKKHTDLLQTIADNTALTNSSMGGLSGALGPGAGEGGIKGLSGKMGKLGSATTKLAGGLAAAAPAIIAGIDTVKDIYVRGDEAVQADRSMDDTAGKYQDLVASEGELRLEYLRALSSGDTLDIETAKRMLDQGVERKNQALDMYEGASDQKVAATVAAISKGVLAVAGGIVGGIFGGPMGAAAGIAAGNVIGGGIGKATAWGMEEGTDAATAAARKRNRQELRRFSTGGIVEEPTVGLIGEGDGPEVIIPLGPGQAPRAEELLSQVQNMSNVSQDTKDVLAPQQSLAESIIASAAALVGKSPYIANSRYMDKPEKGMVCNQLVEYAYKSAGVSLKSRSVRNHLRSGDWELTDNPQPGYAVFSNYGDYNGKYPERAGYRHMGIVGMGENRLHSSSVGGIGVTQGSLKSLRNEKKRTGADPVYGYLRGVDYGLMGEPISTIIPDTPRYLPAQRYEDATVEASLEDDKFFDMPASMLYSSFLRNKKVNTNTMNAGIIEELLGLRATADDETLAGLVANNNPLGVTDSYGQLETFNSMQGGIDTFIERMEKSHFNNQRLSPQEQLRVLHETHSISSSDYRSLITSIQRLTQVISSSTLATRTGNVPSESYPKRNYV